MLLTLIFVNYDFNKVESRQNIIRSKLPTEGWNPGLTLSDVHGLSVAGHADVLWQYGWLDRDAVWHVGCGWSK